MGLALQIAAGIGLASCAGLRAFLPLFVVGAAARSGLIHLGARFGWLESTPALVLLGTAVVAEFLADKYPVVDHVLDGIGVLVKPLAGALVMASTLSETSSLAAVVLAIILGMPAAAGVHLVKAKIRLVSTATTLGLANPAQSLVEDVLSLTGSVLCVLLPAIALALLILLVFVVLRRAGPRRP